ncbi:MAG: hypothetical protein OEZ13_13595 [Spirochaetia bacterium]|nr:hypothetical protein [Spirochaetia bacterium]
MKTTIYIEDNLIKKIKTQAAKEGISLTAYTEKALRQSLYQKRKIQKYTENDIPVFKGGGLMPDIDISNFSNILDTIEKK